MKEQQDIRTLVIRSLSEVAVTIPESGVHNGTLLDEDLGIDSTRFIEAILGVEDALGTEIDDEVLTASNLMTVSDFIAVVEEQFKADERTSGINHDTSD